MLASQVALQLDHVVDRVARGRCEKLLPGHAPDAQHGVGSNIKLDVPIPEGPFVVPLWN